MCFSGCALSGGYRQVRVTALEAVLALSSSDSVALNNLIHPRLGLWVIHRPGAIDAVTNLEKPVSLRNWNRYLAYVRAERVGRPAAGKLSHTCETDSWNRTGFVICDTCNDDKLRIIADFRKAWFSDTMPEKQRKKAETVLKSDVKCWYVEDVNAPGLVFQLTWYENRWWLTVLNLVDSDCGA